MRKNLLKKSLVFGLMLTFITASILPSVIGTSSGMVNTFSNKKEKNFNILSTMMDKVRYFRDAKDKDAGAPMGVSVPPGWPPHCDIIVPDNYSSIQEAIDEAKPGYCCICVRSGTYNEDVEIDKNGICLYGEKGDDGEYITEIGIPKITDILKPATVWINGADGCTVSGFKITGWSDGFQLDSCSFNTISDNYIAGVELEDGIVLDYISYNNTILNNIVEDCRENGIILDNGCHDNNISYNKVMYPAQLNNNTCGIKITTSRAENYDKYGFCYNNTIYHNTITKAPQTCPALVLYGGAHHNYIIHNEILDNSYWGISIGGPKTSSCDNYVAYNVIDENSKGIKIRSMSCGNTICNNIITNNTNLGIEVRDSSDYNVFFLNHFEGNGKTADDECENDWHSTEKMWYNCTYNGVHCGGYDYVGNWWDDYAWMDKNCNCRGDNPKIIDGNGNKDEYPIGWRNAVAITFRTPDEGEGLWYVTGDVIRSTPDGSGDTWIFGGIRLQVDLEYHDPDIEIECVDYTTDSSYPYNDNWEWEGKGETSPYYEITWTGFYGWVRLNATVTWTLDSREYTVCHWIWVLKI